MTGHPIYLTDLVGAIIAVFLLAVFYEGLKTFREYLLYLDFKHSKKARGSTHGGYKSTSIPPDDKSSLIFIVNTISHHLPLIPSPPVGMSDEVE